MPAPTPHVAGRPPFGPASDGDGSGAMFDGIARRYDLLNRLNSLGLDRAWRRETAEALQLDRLRGGGLARVLDVACGTGDLALAVAKRYPEARVVGIDPSREMTAIGRSKLDRLGLGGRVELGGGDARKIAFPDGSFDAVTIAFGIRNVPDRPAALREMARVTRPGGTVAVLELGDPPPGPAGWLPRFHIRFVVPRVGALLAGAAEYRYLERSIRTFPPVAEFARAMAAAGLGAVETRRLTFGVCNLFLARPGAGRPLTEEAVR